MSTSAHYFRKILLLFSLTVAIAYAGGIAHGQTPTRGTAKHPIIDSKMSEAEAFDSLEAMS